MTREAALGWALVFHIFGVVSWLGSLLVVSAILAKVPMEVGVAKERFIVTARQLLKIGGNIGAALTVAFGTVLIVLKPELLRHGWLYVKLLLVLVLLLVHGRLYHRIVALENDPGSATEREFKITHLLVAALLLAILILAVMKPL
jgi:protoporphyrinogen IX oxidase